MARYGMVIDLTKCFGCSACTVACKVENNVPMEQFRTKVQKVGPEGKYPNLKMSFFPSQCNHCDLAPCIEACPKGGRTNGIE